MGKRQVIEGRGLPRHDNPIPTAVRIGPFVFSSALGSEDPETQARAAEPAQEVAQAFRNMRNVIEAAGGTTDDIAKVTVYLRDLQQRALVNEEWLKMFPDEHDRPVRHTVQASPPRGMILQLEFVAVL